MKVEARNIDEKIWKDKTLFQDLNIEINGKDSIVITGDSQDSVNLHS